ncbi:MAG: hypothetical protein HYY50_05395 [Candidatus Kerfeldbacteria bacterium]|nr:hypothetical protein [Candidatus Kerfeldbacteria bacterium]
MGFTRRCKSGREAMTVAEVQAGTVALRELARLHPDHLAIKRESPQDMGIVLATMRRFVMVAYDSLDDARKDRGGRVEADVESMEVDAIEFLPKRHSDGFRLRLAWTKTYGDPPLDPLVKRAYECRRDAVNGKLVLTCDGDDWDDPNPPRY